MWFNYLRIHERDQPGNHGKQESGGKTAHQNARYTFYWGYRSPRLVKGQVGADRRILASCETESGLPTRKTFPAIEGCPQKNLREVQAHKQTRKSHHKHRRLKYAYMVNTLGKVSF